MTAYCRSEILGHIKGCSVLSEKDFFIQTDGREVHLDTAILFLLEHALFKALKDFLFSVFICFGLVIVFIEGNTHVFVAFLQALESPVVHFLPKGSDFLVSIFPSLKHLLGFDSRIDPVRSIYTVRIILLLFFGFLFPLGEAHIVASYEVVSLLTCGFRCLAITEDFVCKHTLTDVYTSVVDEVYLHDFRALALNEG